MPAPMPVDEAACPDRQRSFSTQRVKAPMVTRYRSEWSMADHMEMPLVKEALALAILHRRPLAGLLHHSYRGVQYASCDYRHMLDVHQMKPSMSAEGDR